MPRRVTQKDFLRRSRAAHGNKYDYSEAVYRGCYHRVTIICRKHGPFKQWPYNHCLEGNGCPKCGDESKAAKLAFTQETFVSKSRSVHGNRYDYSKAVYVNAHTKVTIICRKHGPFQQQAVTHLNASGCPRCVGELKLTQKDFLQRSRAAHGDTYDYSEAVYRGTCEAVVIICRKHGAFNQYAGEHLGGHGCRRCGNEGRAARSALTQKTFVSKSRSVHSNRYDYSKAVYVNNETKVTIICRKHGPFKQWPFNHYWLGNGCPRCNESQGEKEVINILTTIGVRFARQAKLIPGKQHAFDFHLSQQRVLIEYNGQQHYVVLPYLGGKKEFDYIRQRDAFKKRWARRNGYRLIVIPYTVVNIEGYLRKRLGYLKEAA